MKNIFKKIKWAIAISVTAFGLTFWIKSSKEEGHKPKSDIGVSKDSTTSTTKTDSLK